MGRPGGRGLTWREVADGGDGLADHAVVGAGVVGGPADFVFDVRHGLERKLDDVGEGGGFAGGDFALREGLEDFAEDVVDVEAGVEIAGEGSELGGEFFGFVELVFFAGVEDAQSGMSELAEHAALASIVEGAETTGAAGLLGVHGIYLSYLDSERDVPQRHGER